MSENGESFSSIYALLFVCGTEGLVEIGNIRVFLSAETEGPVENQFQQHLLCSQIGILLKAEFPSLSMSCLA
jgi:hypothetical protein